MTIAIGSSGTTKSRGLTNLVELKVVYILRQPTGKWSWIGFLITFNSFIGPFAALMLILWRSWTEISNKLVSKCKNLKCNMNSPIKPANLVYVLGILVWGLTSINTFFAVWMYTCKSPARLRGESRSMSKHWWVISGLHEDGSRLCFFKNPMWSSQLRSSKSRPT